MGNKYSKKVLTQRVSTTSAKQLKVLSYWIREFEQNNSSKNHWINDLSLLVLKYSKIIEMWDTLDTGKNITINNFKASNNFDDFTTARGLAFGTFRFSKGKYRWKFKLTSVAKESNLWSHIIGIMPISSCRKHRNETFEDGYGYMTLWPNSIHPRTQYGTYGIKCKQNDIIEMIVDMNKLEIEYILNNKSLGICFPRLIYNKMVSIKKGEYRMCVSFFDKGKKEIQLMDFQCLEEN